jgi:hypothetical protein
MRWECENPEGISKRSGNGVKPALWFSVLSTPRHFQRLTSLLRVEVEDDQLTANAL